MLNLDCVSDIFFYRKPARKPSWLPDELAWVHPTKRNDSTAARAMTPAQFLDNQRLVLRAAYESAGYNADTYTSTKSRNRKMEDHEGLTVRLDAARQIHLQNMVTAGPSNLLPSHQPSAIPPREGPLISKCNLTSQH